MPDPVAEGAPEGRTDPGSGLGTKIGPLPLGLWILVGGGILVGVWWFKRNQSSSGSNSLGLGTTGATDSAGNPIDNSNAGLDPATLADLNAAMQDLAKKLGATSISPAPGTPAIATPAQGNPVNWLQNTTHTSGGNDTASTNGSGLVPDTRSVIGKTISSLLNKNPIPALSPLSTLPSFVTGQPVPTRPVAPPDNRIDLRPYISNAFSWLTPKPSTPKPTPSSASSQRGAFA
jgi:hypothetical protein